MKKVYLTLLLVMGSSFVCQGAGRFQGAVGAVSERRLYAVNQSEMRGTISIYDIDRGHRLKKILTPVTDVGEVRGVVANKNTGQLFVSYNNKAGIGMIYALNISSEKLIWNKIIPPNVDRLSISPDGSTLFVPTSENSTDPVFYFINRVEAATGNLLERIPSEGRSHDTLYPPSGPIFQECKMTDGTCDFLEIIDPATFKVTKVGPFASFLGPFSVDSTSTFAVSDVNNIDGMQVADLKTGKIVTARLPGAAQSGLPHGIGWTPDQREVWQGNLSNPNIGIWDMADPMKPKFLMFLPIASSSGSHWLTFSIRGDFAYISPQKDSSVPTEIFDVRTHTSVAKIASSEDMIEIDFTDGKITQVGDQYGIGRR